MKVHLSLPVADVERTAAFYTVLFQAPPSKLKTDYVKFEPETLALNISFHRVVEPVDTRRHLGLQVATAQQLESQYERLQKAGLVSSERNQQVCCYAAQDKFWVKDPDGYEWELYLRLEDTEAKMGAGSCCEPATSAPACTC